MSDCRPGAIEGLREVLAEHRPARVALVTGGASYALCGAAAAVEPMLEGITVERVSDVAPNPTLESVAETVEVLRGLEPQLVIAVGGGSVLDLAKAARSLVRETDLRAAVVSARLSGTRAHAPLVAIPTTAGTGSEATHFAAVYVDGVKHSVGDESFRPEHVLLDPGLTASLPPRVTAETGLDALSQAIESLWSARSTDESRGHARRALELAWGSLESAVRSPSPAARAAMCTAAHLSGLAIDVSRTTAAHALSYTITTRHDVAHGHAVALTLGPLLEYNSGVGDDDCMDPRGPGFVQARIGEILEVLGASDGVEGKTRLRALVERLGLETTLSAVGAASPAARRAIVDGVDADRLGNNPRALDRMQLAAIVESVA
jgi:alcohol dehydrogenase class IV